MLDAAASKSDLMNVEINNQDAAREGFRLSPQQKYLWMLQQATPAQPYRAIGMVRVDGSTNSEELSQRVAEVAARHETLRTTFVRSPGIKTPFQVVSEDTRFSWSQLDLSGLNSAEQQTRLGQFFDEERRQPFDFEQGPLLHVHCLKLANDQHVLLVMLPALCADQVTLWNLANELSQDNESEELPIQYADYAEWQNGLLASDDKVAVQGRAYWEQQQEVLTKSALTLPFEKRLQQSSGFEPDSVAFDLADDLLAKIEMIAERYETSAPVVLFACWQALLWRLTGQSDFVIWNLNDGRKLEDLRSAMGLYARYLPVSCPGGDRTFADYLKHSKSALAQNEEWQAYFDPLSAEDQSAATDAHAIAFEFQTGVTQEAGAALSCSVTKQFVCLRPFKIKLGFLSNGNSLLPAVEYNSKVLDRDSADRIIGYYTGLLANLIAQPDKTIGALNILDADEQRRLILEFNETNVAYPARCIHELFEEQVSKTPDLAAVVCDGKLLTYSELNQRANRLAHLLRKRGVAPETAVALCMSRSVEMIVGLLGILKAGGGYVPLNPDHPAARLENQLAQSQATICLTNDSDIGLLGKNVEVIDLSLPVNEADTNPETRTTPENLVYVIFTSGSTGVPKGVSVRHRNLVNYTGFILDKLAIKAPLNFAIVSTISADLGNTCIFPSLLSGGCLHILNDEIAMEGSLFAQYISDNSIDVLKIVPSHLNALLTSTAENILPAKYLLLGGESLSWDLIKRLLQLEHTCKIINHYGPTETTVGSLTYTIEEANVSGDLLTVPIGRPIANTRAYLLNKYLMPIPQGVIGELFIGGAGVADGYRNQSAETAARFLPDPFSSTPGARLYRTGDLARRLPAGDIEFIGRADRQVKIRGYRIELAEIETAIEEQPGIIQAVVVVRSENDDNQHLVAYMTTSGVKSPSYDDIRLALTQRLPSYMIPSSVVFLESFPLTPNGKLNRAALPEPDQARPDRRKAFVAPRTASEKEIAEIWASVLKLTEVSIHDDFFELGGHSLLATQVVARVRKAFKFNIPLRSIFESPTIAKLAERIDSETEAEMSELLTALEALSDEEAQKVLAMEKARQSRENS